MGALVVFAAAFGAYAWTASAVPGWLDSSEFVAASASLGVAHSPGHPIAVLLGRAATLVPLGDMPFRVALASAAMAAAAAACAYLAARRLAARLAPEAHARVHELCGVCVGLGLAASGALWIQAVRAEVYGLELALLALALALLFDGKERLTRALPAAGLAVGLGLANHHFITLLFAAPAAAYALAQRPGARTLARTAMCGVLGLCAFAYLPLRAARAPLVDWGDPDTLGRFMWTVSGKAFTKTLGENAGRQSRGEDLAQVAVTLLEHISVAAVLLLLIGLYLWVRRRAPAGPALLLGGIVALAAGGRAMLGFDFDNPDALGYLLPAVLALLLLAGAGAALLAGALLGGGARRALIVPLALIAAVPVLQVSAHARASTRRFAAASDMYARAVVDDLPPRALLVTSYFETYFQVWALQAVEDDRPDVLHVDRGFATYPGMQALDARRMPEVAGIDLRVGAPTPVAALQQLARTRPVYFELSTTLDDPARAYLEPAAPLARWSAGAPVDDSARFVALADQLLAGEADEPGAHRLALWHAFLRAEFLCSINSPRAPAALELAQRIAPDDQTLAELAAHCNFSPP